MRDMDSGRLLAHIDEAKNWLDKAKEEYSGSNRIRGDLHLNLAQAEVKCAWELSRQSDVLNIDAIRQTSQPSWRQRYILPAAAVLMAGLMIGGIFYLQSQRSFGVKNDSIAQQTEVAETIKPQPVTLTAPAAQTPPMASAQSVPETEVSRPVPVKPDPPVVKVSKVDQSDESKVDEVKYHSVEMPRNPTEGIVPVAANAIAGGRTDSSSVAGKIHPVSSFTIDEEALTKEASKSLRLGK